MKTLLSTIAIAVTPTQRQLLQAIDETDLSHIIRHAIKDLAKSGDEVVLNPEEADYALKQYYALAAINPANLHAVSARVDPYWHAHILHTKEYAAFCEQGIGYFMHHDPLDESDTLKAQAVGDVYGYTLDILDVIFQGNVNPAAWGRNIEENRICFHFHRTAPAESLYPVDPRFAKTRGLYALVA